MVVGRLLSYWDSVTFQGRTVKLREGIKSRHFCHIFSASDLRLGKLTFDFVGWSSIKLLEEGLTNLSGAAWRYAILMEVSMLRVAYPRFADGCVPESWLEIWKCLELQEAQDASYD